MGDTRVVCHWSYRRALLRAASTECVQHDKSVRRTCGAFSADQSGARVKKTRRQAARDRGQMGASLTKNEQESLSKAVSQVITDVTTKNEADIANSTSETQSINISIGPTGVIDC